ncbi:MAG: L,D-transpeptidase [Pseudomonadota bacterium]
MIMVVLKRSLIILAGLSLLLFIVLEGLGIYYGKYAMARVSEQDEPPPQNAKQDPEKLSQQLRQKLDKMAPAGVYIVVDTAANRLYLKNGDKVLREAVISSGSGKVLEDNVKDRTWVFDTPRGVFSVKSKQKDPMWVKPDWAYVEEGEPLPKNNKDRFERGVLGDYALGFGNGFFIHGTLYTRLLGRNVTHGCIRVGDADLEAVFAAASIGTKIYIF